ncbi:MAG: alpha/beta hydrolase family protein [Planctomycetota bacterium]
MALLQCEFFSESLKRGVSMNVILPQPVGESAIGIDGGPAGMPEHGYPTLWLLHGLSDDHTAWCRRTSIERYVSGLGLAVVMPNVDRSYYADMARGGAYWTFISEELPRVCRRMFRLSSRREDNFTAGLSMGGYGAFKLVLNHPDRYAAAASLSGALDPVGLLNELPERADEWTHIFGDPPRVEGTGSDLFAQSQTLAERGHGQLSLYACCGTGDFIYHHSTKFRDHADAIGLNLTYEEHVGQEHEWGYWDQQIQRVLEWLPMPKTEQAER